MYTSESEVMNIIRVWRLHKYVLSESGPLMDLKVAFLLEKSVIRIVQLDLQLTKGPFYFYPL